MARARAHIKYHDLDLAIAAPMVAGQAKRRLPSASAARVNYASVSRAAARRALEAPPAACRRPAQSQLVSSSSALLLASSDSWPAGGARGEPALIQLNYHEIISVIIVIAITIIISVLSFLLLPLL